MWEDEAAIMCIFSNISNDIYQDRVDKLNEFKNHIYGRLSHNLRTPLNAIQILNEYQNNETNIDKIHETSEDIGNNC